MMALLFIYSNIGWKSVADVGVNERCMGCVHTPPIPLISESSWLFFQNNFSHDEIHKFTYNINFSLCWTSEVLYTLKAQSALNQEKFFICTS